MGIILFLVDTSASMNQRTFLGTCYLDVAKGAIDTFMKVRTRGARWVRNFRTPVREGGFFTNICSTSLCLLCCCSTVREILQVGGIDICWSLSTNLQMP